MKTLKEIGKEFNAYSGASAFWFAALQRAAEELGEASYEDADERGAAELADVILVLASLAARYNLDLDAAVQEKHAINMTRKWGPHPTIHGAVKHIKEGK